MTAEADHAFATTIRQYATMPLAPRQSKWGDEWWLWASSVSALYTVTREPGSVLQTLRAVAAKHDVPMITWDCARGFTSDSIDLLPALSNLTQAAPFLQNDPQFQHPYSFLYATKRLDVSHYVGKRGGSSAIFVALDFFEFFDAARVRQEFTNLLTQGELNYALEDGTVNRRPIHFLQAPYQSLDLKGLGCVKGLMRELPYALPSAEDIRQDEVDELVIITKLQNEQASKDPKARQLVYNDSEPYLMSLAAAAAGIEGRRTREILYMATAQCDGLTPELPGVVGNLVVAELAATGAIDLVPPDRLVHYKDLAGVDEVVAALRKAARTRLPRAKTLHIDEALGLWLCGVPGTGKTSLAQAGATVFAEETGLPHRFVRVRIGAIYGSLVGQTEQNWYELEDRLRAIGPNLIVLIDEVDKVFGDVMQRQGDSGVSKMLFAQFLNFTADVHRRGGIYIMLGLNDPSGLPDEALREGRFDGGFFFDLPDEITRRKILEIHFRKRLAFDTKDLDALAYSEEDWVQLARMTEHWLPGELEGLVRAARERAFELRNTNLPTIADVKHLIQLRTEEATATELSRDAQKAMLERINRLREVCFGKRARPAMKAVPPVAPNLAQPLPLVARRRAVAVATTHDRHPEGERR